MHVIQYSKNCQRNSTQTIIPRRQKASISGQYICRAPDSQCLCYKSGCVVSRIRNHYNIRPVHLFFSPHLLYEL